MTDKNHNENSDFTTEEELFLLRNKDGKVVGIKDLRQANFQATMKDWKSHLPKMKPVSIIIWIIIALLGAIAWSIIAVSRGETINAIWFVIAAVCSYIIAYRFYALYIQRKIMQPDDSRATPSEVHNDGQEFDPTNRVVLFGHHFASIAGAGPLVGPILAAQMGYLPGTVWIIFGVIFAGGVQDMLVLWYSHRRDARSIGAMARDEVGKFAGGLTSFIVFIMTMIVLAVLALICITAMAGSPWAVFSIGMTIPIALIMGVYLKFIRPGRVNEVSLIGFALLLVAIFAGRWVSETPSVAHIFTLSQSTLVWWVMGYTFVAAIIPAWILLTPRDYLSMFMKIGTILILAVAVIGVRPDVTIPALTNFAGNSNGPVFAGSLFPFLFITIACGALSGFHVMMSSGTTPHLIKKESQTRMIGYGGMLFESFVAIMALVAAISLNPGVYYSMNTPQASMQKLVGKAYNTNATNTTNVKSAAIAAEGNAALAIPKIAMNPNGKPMTIDWEGTTGQAALRQVAKDVGEISVVSRTGGAPTLAVSMSNILKRVPIIGGTGMMGFWYHFAVMFEALFILSAVSAATKSTRYLLTDALSNSKRKAIKRFGDENWLPGKIVTTAIIVGVWGALLLMGVSDPNGGIRIMYPLFGISNQLIAAAALAIVCVMVVRKGYLKWLWIPAIPLVWDVLVTFTASWEKIFSGNVNIGYFAAYSTAQKAVNSGTLSGVSLTNAEATVRNSLIQGSLSVVFLACVALLLILCVIRVITVVRVKQVGAEFSSETAYIPSHLFETSSFWATKLEHKVLKNKK
ncbi:carbon starvation protein A [Lactococcus hircilactis]|uniref:Carbon starvation protein A n=1 Tax=Lactococcus hircilactis TaxID=1494462 RepID=A0A7X1Z809_9LACT|nr:carbon starvation CstA family protein [Lactococcus hircilactis]MQW38432.1 carbon starvation protein A [Lactococcus hircilactis]